MKSISFYKSINGYRITMHQAEYHASLLFTKTMYSKAKYSYITKWKLHKRFLLWCKHLLSYSTQDLSVWVCDSFLKRLSLFIGQVWERTAVKLVQHLELSTNPSIQIQQQRRLETNCSTSIVVLWILAHFYRRYNSHSLMNSWQSRTMQRFEAIISVIGISYSLVTSILMRRYAGNVFVSLHNRPCRCWQRWIPYYLRHIFQHACECGHKPRALRQMAMRYSRKKLFIVLRGTNPSNLIHCYLSSYSNSVWF